MILELKNLDKRFRGIHALKDVSANFEKGEIVCVVGDNGAGKSTLMSCVTGGTASEKGVIIFDGQIIKNNSPRTSRALGIEMVYQNLSLCQNQDILTNIFLGSEETGLFFSNKRKMLKKCLELFKKLKIDLSPKLIVGNLSGGQQQIIAIARAMLQDPKLLILDEPTAALSAKESQKVLQNIKELKSLGVSIIMITHRLGNVFEVADRILLMKHGNIVRDILPDETSLNELTSLIVE